MEDSKGQIDFAAAFAVVHEVPYSKDFFSEVHETIKPGGQLLMSEPKGHVSREDFEGIVSTAEQAGFVVKDRPQISRSHTVLLGKEL